MLLLLVVVLLILFAGGNYGAVRGSWYGPGIGNILYVLLAIVLIIVLFNAVGGYHGRIW